MLNPMNDAEQDDAEPPSSKHDAAPAASELDVEQPEPDREPESTHAESRSAKKRSDTRTPAPRSPLRLSAAHGLALLSGLLYFLAFPGIGLWPLSFVALAPLIVALHGQTPRRAGAIGWTSGFTMTMCGFYWLLGMLQTFSGFSTPLCLLFMSILCAYQAGRMVACGWLTVRAEERGWPPGVAFSLAFVASELVYPLLFPWAYGATVHQIPALVQLGELGGPIAVGLVLVAPNLALAELVIAKLEHRAPSWKKIGALAAVPAFAALYGAIRIPMVDAAVAAGPKAHVGLVQANMSLMGKRRDRNEGLRRHMELTRELQRRGPLDLVVWSETSVMAPQDEEIAPSVYRTQFTASLGVPAVFGAVLVRKVEDVRGYVLFNSALLSDGQGEVRGRYDKQFLLAFGEYLPLGEQFPSLYEISRNSGRFTPGKTLAPLRLGEHGIATFICYEDIIPSFVRSIVKSGDTDLLVNLTNDAWFGDTTEPWIHLALSQLRAVEHRRFLLRSTNSGVSAIVDPVGRVVTHSSTFRQEAVSGSITWLRASTGYELWGDGPWWIATLASLVLAFVRRRAKE
jgi:apolipoprotein N-acyltransferase